LTDTLGWHVRAKLTLLLAKFYDFSHDCIPLTLSIGDDLGRARFESLVRVQNLQIGIADGIPHVAHLGAREGQQTFGAGGVAVKIARCVFPVVVVDLPELRHDDVALGGKVGVETSLRDAGLTGDCFNGDCVETALAKQSKRALENGGFGLTRTLLLRSQRWLTVNDLPPV
jgi:hypothetical protein